MAVAQNFKPMLAAPETNTNGQRAFEADWMLKHGVKDFKYEECRAWKYLFRRFGKMSKMELQSLGAVVAETLDIQLVREYKRRKITMIMWFDEHFDEVMPFIRNHVDVLERDGKPVLLHDEDPTLYPPDDKEGRADPI